MSYRLYSQCYVNPKVTPTCNHIVYGLIGDVTYDTHRTLLYKCDSYDEFVEKVTMYIVTKHRLCVEEDAEDEECMYADYPETIRNMVKHKLQFVKHSLEPVFEDLETDDLAVEYVAKVDTSSADKIATSTSSQFQPKTVVADEVAKYDDLMTCLDITNLLPEIPHKWNDPAILIQRQHRSLITYRVNMLIQLTHTRWNLDETTPNGKCCTLMLKDKLTQESIKYTDLSAALFEQPYSHPLWKRYLDA
jgi:hypothetical protein